MAAWTRSLMLASCIFHHAGHAFHTQSRSSQYHEHRIASSSPPSSIIARTELHSSPQDENTNEPISIRIDTKLSDDRIRNLFAWITMAFQNDDNNNPYAYYYQNIELAIASSFGDNLPVDSLPAKLMEMAIQSVNSGDNGDYLHSREWEEKLIGEGINRRDRESASLGAMGAAQWSGRFMTRPHSLLDIRNFTTIDDWVSTLPRGCKRTLRKATPQLQNFTVSNKLIRGGHPSPHSSYAHFRCVVQHEVRLLSNMYGGGGSGDNTNPGVFINALAEAISRYMGTTRMAGNIKEYRDSNTNTVIGFAHEVAKGRTVRGQWFYCDDDAATRYVWFHSVYELVKQAIEDDRIDVVDLGPSGSDAFTELKTKYGFESVVDWPAVADYRGEFLYEENQNEKEVEDDMMRLMQEVFRRRDA